MIWKSENYMRNVFPVPIHWLALLRSRESYRKWKKKCSVTGSYFFAGRKSQYLTVSTMWGSHCLLSYRKKCVYVGGSGEEGNSSGFAGLRTITYISSNKNTTFYLFTGNAAKSQQKLLQWQFQGNTSTQSSPEVNIFQEQGSKRWTTEINQGTWLRKKVHQCIFI